jgi:hypothetical protein
MGQSPVEMFLGVGLADLIDSLVIRWPNGTVQQFDNVPVNCSVKIVEGRDELLQKPFADESNRSVTKD